MLHPLRNIDITKYSNYDPRFNGVFLRDNLPRIKDESYVMNLDDKKSKGTHSVLLVIAQNTAVDVDFFGIEYIL